MSYQPAPTNFQPVVAGQPTNYQQNPQYAQQQYPQQQYPQQQYPQQQYPQQQLPQQQYPPGPNQQYYQPNPQYQQAVYVPAQSQVVSSVVYTKAVVVPTSNVCCYCNQQYMVITERRVGTLAVCMGILMVFIFWPCFWLPYVMDGCKDEYQLCSSCGHEIGHRSAC